MFGNDVLTRDAVLLERDVSSAKVDVNGLIDDVVVDFTVVARVAVTVLEEFDEDDVIVEISLLEGLEKNAYNLVFPVDVITNAIIEAVILSNL